MKDISTYLKFFSSTMLSAIIVIPTGASALDTTSKASESSFYICDKKNDSNIKCSDGLYYKKVTDSKILQALKKEMDAKKGNELGVVIDGISVNSLDELLLEVRKSEAFQKSSYAKKKLSNKDLLSLMVFKDEIKLSDMPMELKTFGKTSEKLPTEKSSQLKSVVMKALVDEEFRKQLGSNPKAASEKIGKTLTPSEINELDKLKVSEWDVGNLDDLTKKIQDVQQFSKVSIGSFWFKAGPVEDQAM